MAKSYLDSEGLLYLWQKIKNLFAAKGDSIKNITRSGTTFTATKADGTSFTFTQQDEDTWTPMTGATSSADGSVGYVNATPPSDGYNTKFLRADGTWSVPPGTSVTPASSTPIMDGVGAVGTSTSYAREDHVHPSDTSRVPNTRTVNGKALSTDISLDASDVSAIPTSAKGAASGVCPLNASSKIDSSYLPSYVDDVVEVYARTAGTPLSADWFSTTSASGSALTPESGVIYVLVADSGSYAANSQFRWTGTAYVRLADGGVSSITNAEIDTIVAS